MKIIIESDGAGIKISVFCFFCENPEHNRVNVPDFLAPILNPILAMPGINDLQLPGNYLCQKCCDEWANVPSFITPEEESLSDGADSSSEKEDSYIPVPNADENEGHGETD